MNAKRKISAALTKIRMKNPFLGTLALFVEHRLDETIPTACTDDKNIWYNPKFVEDCSLNEIGAVVLHELLHAALMHNARRGERDPMLWNIAADIVVNGIVRQEAWARLPFNPIIDEKLEELRVEEVYETLLKKGRRKIELPDQWNDLTTASVGDSGGLIDKTQDDQLKGHWKQAWQQAQLVHEMKAIGTMGSNLKRLLNEITLPQVDWRTRLWQYLTSTPNDFIGWDRRFIHDGLYLESLEGEDLQVKICIDTSGSIHTELLSQFVTELEAILRSYPSVKAELYYADTEIFGPYDLESKQSIPTPKGGGGTSFIPFFKAVDEADGMSSRVSIYLTDGYGDFPKIVPKVDTLWVVPSNGLRNDQFPFGEVARIEAA
ncbi:VWA-like domain-containing protein [bacterium]|nr:VWA-like domain-containing protein [bacterium]